MKKTRTQRKPKYDRRRALDCKLIEKSKKNAGYFKYEVTICEKDGTVHKEPAYGRDMQDAISRLIWKERTIKVEKKMERNPFIFFLIWLVVMAAPVLWNGDITYTPWFILYMFGSFSAMFLFAGLWQNYLDKKN